jgi:hypothetical protein
MYLVGMKYHGLQQQQILMITVNPPVSYLKTYHPLKQYWSFMKLGKLWLCINKHQWVKIGIQKAGGEKKPVAMNQRTFPN